MLFLRKGDQTNFFISEKNAVSETIFFHPKDVKTGRQISCYSSIVGST